MTRALYSWGVQHGVLHIIDQHDGNSMSVTNDIETVLKAIAEKLWPLPEKIIYRDTEGVWDQVICGDQFEVRFQSLGAGGLEGALEAVIKRVEDSTDGAVT